MKKMARKNKYKEIPNTAKVMESLNACHPRAWTRRISKAIIKTHSGLPMYSLYADFDKKQVVDLND